jgi:predicted O-methyltransferase YrrM
MTPREVDNLIKSTFRVKRRDTLPFTGWLKSTREDIAKLYNTLGFKVGAEIGVQRGGHAMMLLDTVEGLKLYCVDPWKAYNRISQEKMEGVFENCKKRLKDRNAELMKMTSMEAVKHFDDFSLDFVYIDGLHEFDSVMRDVMHWSRKVRPGGIVAGHDYFPFYQSGVIPAIDAYTRAHNINDFYITTADDYQSWFWVQKEEYQQGYSF